MTTLLLCIWILLVLGLIVSLAIYPKRTHHSHYELERLHDTATMRRERLLGGVFGLRRVAVLVFAIMATLMAVMVFGGWSVLVMIGVTLLVIPVARGRFIVATVGRYYERYEPHILGFVEKNPIAGWFMLPGDKTPRDHGLESVEQLLHQVDAASFLSDDQHTIITQGVNWHQTTVETVMTPRQHIASVKRSELLGPLVLDDLHKTGHSRFPVTKTKNGLDEIVGVLSIADLLELNTNRSSQTAEQAMAAKVLRVENDESLPVALALLQKSHLHMLIVTDAEGKTVGLVTLADITGSLLGKTEVK